MKLLEDRGALTRLARLRINLAHWEWVCGSPEAAHRLVTAAIEQLKGVPPGRILGEAAMVLARLTQDEDPARASRLLGYATQLFGEAVAMRTEIADLRAALLTKLDAAHFEAEHTAGLRADALPA